MKRLQHVIHFLIYDARCGPSKFARFEPAPDAHGGYDPIADERGEDYFVEDKAKQYRNQGYSWEQSGELAHADGKRVRQARDALNHKFYYELELNRADSEIEYTIELDERDGEYHLFHEEFQQFLPDTIKNWERYLTEKNQMHLFNAPEAAAILEMDRLLSRGEVTSAVYAVSEPVVGGEVRYMNQFVYENGKVKTQYLDVGKFVRDLSPEEGHDAVLRLGNSNDVSIRGKGEGEYLFLTSNSKVFSPAEIRESVFHKLAEVDGFEHVAERLDKWKTAFQKDMSDRIEGTRSISTDVVMGIRDTYLETGYHVGKDVRDTLVPLGTLMAAHIFRREQFKKEQKTSKETLEEKKEIVIKEKLTVVQRFQKFFLRRETKDKNLENNKSETDTKQPDEAVTLETSEAKNPNNQERENQQVIALALLPVAGEAGLVPLIVSVFSQSQPVEKTITREIETQQTKPTSEEVVLMEERETKKVLQKKKHNKKLKRIESTLKVETLDHGEFTKKHEQFDGKSVILFSERNVIVTERIRRRKRKKIIKEFIKQDKPEIRLLVLSVILSDQLKSLKKVEKKQSRKKEVREKKNNVERVMGKHIHGERNKQKETVVSFFLALALFRLMEQSNIPESIADQKAERDIENQDILLDTKSEGKHTIKKARAEPSEHGGWLLLTIIWHLSLLAEGGALSMSKAKSQNLKAKKKRAKVRKKKLRIKNRKSAKKIKSLRVKRIGDLTKTLSKSGVIFVYPSVLQ